MKGVFLITFLTFVLFVYCDESDKGMTNTDEDTIMTPVLHFHSWNVTTSIVTKSKFNYVLPPCGNNSSMSLKR